MARASGGRKVLYLTFDGLADPLGRSQILPYLTGLAARGHDITIISCEKQARFDAGGAAVKQICDRAGIKWHHIPYAKRPPVMAHAYTVARLTRAAARLHRQVGGFDIVHCRSYPPGLVGLHLKRRFGIRFLFDIRGFWADEKVEGGSWPQGNPVYRAVYRYLKRAEKRLFAGADHIVSLTDAGKRVMLQRPELASSGDRITVIPCCVDFQHFPLVQVAEREKARRLLDIPSDAKVLSYLGSLGTWYMLEEMLDFFRTYLSRYPDTRFLFVTPGDHGPIMAAAHAAGLPAERIIARGATREEVPKLMAAADLGLFFIRPVSSKAASSPTKMGEMLALGLPTVANDGVGDVAEILASTGAGVAVSAFSPDAYQRAMEAVDRIWLPPEEIRRRALPWFDVELGIERYDSIYRSL